MSDSIAASTHNVLTSAALYQPSLRIDGHEYMTMDVSGTIFGRPILAARATTQDRVRYLYEAPTMDYSMIAQKVTIVEQLRFSITSRIPAARNAHTQSALWCLGRNTNGASVVPANDVETWRAYGLRVADIVVDVGGSIAYDVATVLPTLGGLIPSFEIDALNVAMTRWEVPHNVATLCYNSPLLTSTYATTGLPHSVSMIIGRGTCVGISTKSVGGVPVDADTQSDEAHWSRDASIKVKLACVYFVHSETSPMAALWANPFTTTDVPNVSIYERIVMSPSVVLYKATRSGSRVNLTTDTFEWVSPAAVITVIVFPVVEDAPLSDVPPQRLACSRVVASISMTAPSRAALTEDYANRTLAQVVDEVAQPFTAATYLEVS